MGYYVLKYMRLLHNCGQFKICLNYIPYIMLKVVEKSHVQDKENSIVQYILKIRNIALHICAKTLRMKVTHLRICESTILCYIKRRPNMVPE